MCNICQQILGLELNGVPPNLTERIWSLLDSFHSNLTDSVDTGELNILLEELREQFPENDQIAQAITRNTRLQKAISKQIPDLESQHRLEKTKEPVVEWYDKCDASTGVRWVDIKCSSMVSRVDNGLAERPSLDVPIWKKHPVKRMMKLVNELNIHQEVYGVVQECPPPLSESQVACCGTANSNDSVLAQNHSALHDNGLPPSNTAEDLGPHQDNLEIRDNISPCFDAEKLVSNQENSVSHDTIPSDFPENYSVAKDRNSTTFDSTNTLVEDHDYSVSGNSSSTCRCSTPEPIPPGRKRSSSNGSNSTCHFSTPEPMTLKENDKVAYNNRLSPQSSVATFGTFSSITAAPRKTHNRSDCVNTKHVPSFERAPRARKRKSVSSMKDHGFLSTNCFVSKLVDKFKFNKAEKLDKVSRERYGGTSDRSSRRLSFPAEDRGKNGDKKEKRERYPQGQYPSLKTWSKHRAFNEDEFNNNEDTSCDDAISSDCSSLDRFGSPLNFGSVLNMEKDPPMPKASHGHIRRIKSEAAFKVDAPEPLPNPRDHNRRSSRDTKLTEDFGLPLGEIRIQILTLEEGQRRAQEHADAQMQTRTTHKPSCIFDSQYERQDRRPRSGLSTWKAPTTGPPAELPPLPPNARPKLSRSIPVQYFPPSPKREVDNNRAARASFSTRSYASTSIRLPRKSQHAVEEYNRNEREVRERDDEQVSRESDKRRAAYSRGGRGHIEGREEVNEAPGRKPGRSRRGRLRRDDHEEEDGEALIVKRERVHRSRSSRARPHDLEKNSEVIKAPSQKRSHRSKVSSVRTEDLEGDNWVTYDVLRERRARRDSRANRIAKAEQYQREQRKLWLTSSESSTSSDTSSSHRY